MTVDEYVIRFRDDDGTIGFVTEARAAKPPILARLLHGSHSQAACVTCSNRADLARRFPTAALAECYLERILGSTLDYEIVPLSEITRSQ